MFTGDVPLGRDPTTIANVQPALAHLDSLVGRMTQQNPNKRPESIAEVRKALNLNALTSTARERQGGARASQAATPKDRTTADTVPFTPHGKIADPMEPAWEGVEYQGSFYAWAGPLLQLEDKPGIQYSPQLVEVLR